MKTSPLTMLAFFLPLLWGGLASCQTHDSGTFKGKNEFGFNIPAGAKVVGIWLAKPQDTSYSHVRDFSVAAQGTHETLGDSEGNSYVYIELKNPNAGTFKVTETFTIQASELHVEPDAEKTRALNGAESRELLDELKGYNGCPVNESYKKIANGILKGETNPVLAARLFYDFLLKHVEYWVKDPEHKKASGKGSADYTYEKCTGNCTDFHALYLSLSRSAGFPARVLYGSMFKAPLNGKDVDQSYHCWIEFFAPGIGWIPLDVALADVYHEPLAINETNREKIELTTADGYTGMDKERVDYYFGRLEARRVLWSIGRDLKLDKQRSGAPVDNMAKAYWEIDGQPGGAYDRKLTFIEDN